MTTTTWWQQFKQRFGRRPPVIHTMIDGVQHEVTESCRWQAAINFKLDPELRAKCEDMIGVEEMRRRYPESYR